MSDENLNNKQEGRPEQKPRAGNEEQKEQTVPLYKYEELRSQASACVNAARQIQADFDNYKRRNQNLKEEAMLEGVIKTCDTLLPALDSFKKARKLIIDKTTINGILMIETEILNSLERIGVRRIPSVGKPFNPEVHNAVMLVADFKAKSNTVIEEIKAGYTLNGKVIRVAEVIVAR